MGKVKPYIMPFVISLLGFLMHVSIVYIFQTFTCLSSDVVGLFFGDLMCCAAFAVWYHRTNHKVSWVQDIKQSVVDSIEPKDVKSFHWSELGYFLLSCIFVVNYVFSQAVGLHIKDFYANEYMSVYTSLQGDDLMWYLLLSVTLGPIMEELLFRGICYRAMRTQYGIFFSTFVSAGLFALIHGTTAHIPVTVGLSLFCTFLYECTGKLRQCIVLHIATNIVALLWVIQLPFGFTVSCIGFGIYCIAMLVAFTKIPTLRIRLQRKHGSKTFVETLNEKKLQFGE